MTKALVYLPMLPPAARKRCFDFVRAEFPSLTVDHAETLTAIDPHIDTAEILITFGAHLGLDASSILGRAKKVEWVMALGTGVDHITDVPALRPEAMVTNMHGMHGVPMTESALSLMLAFAREMPRMVHNQEKHHWERYGSRLLYGKTVGILGIGAIAEALGPVCKAFGMKVIGISSTPRKLTGFNEIIRRDALASAIGSFDHFVILTPLTAETRNIVDAKMLAAMKPSAFLINLARGGIVDEDALIAALREKKIGGAAIDVFVQEPLPAAHPFWAMDNVILSPHIGAFNADYIEQVLPFVKENLTRFLAGDVVNMVNVVRKGASHGC
jgi:D-2-hydroxyacid dehydrogenase (NADP+)